MLSSRVAIPFQACTSQTASTESAGLEIHPPGKRKLSDPRYESIKKSILENEVKKVKIFKAIESTGHDESNSNMFCRLSVANFV